MKNTYERENNLEIKNCKELAGKIYINFLK
jgi:hypothetical protein